MSGPRADITKTLLQVPGVWSPGKSVYEYRGPHWTLSQRALQGPGVSCLRIGYQQKGCAMDMRRITIAAHRHKLCGGFCSCESGRNLDV
ncbi:hypothetical protein ACLKA6_006734 [Drosophila palustris]